MRKFSTPCLLCKIMTETIPLTLEFGGGMELLFQNRKSIQIQVPLPSTGKSLRVRELLPFIRDVIKPDRPELFMQEETIFVNSISSPRSDASSAFSSPLPYIKRPRLATLSHSDAEQSTTTRTADETLHSRNLDEIYRNSRRCPRIKEQKWRMASFRATLQVAEIIFTQWEAADPSKSTAEHRARKQQFCNYVVGFVMRVGPSVGTLLHALLYTIKLRTFYPHARGEQGCAHRLFVVSLLAATRYLNDKQVLIRPNHTTWSGLSGVFTAPELHRMEAEFITFLRGKLYISYSELERSVEEFFFNSSADDQMGSIVPGSVDWFELISVKPAASGKPSESPDSLVPQ